MEPKNISYRDFSETNDETFKNALAITVLQNKDDTQSSYDYFSKTFFCTVCCILAHDFPQN